MSPWGTNKMGFIDSVSAAFTHRDTIDGGMHLQKRFGETKRRGASVVWVPCSKLQHVARATETREAHLVESVDVLVSVQTARLQFTNRTEQKSHTRNVLGAHFSLFFLSVISAKMHLSWLWTVVSISTSVCVCSQNLFVKKLKGSEYTLVQSRSSNVRTFFAKSFKKKKVITLFRHHGWLFVTLGSLIYFKKGYLHSFSNWESVFL